MKGSLAPSSHDGSSDERHARRLEVQQYPTLKKSLSASLSMSSRSPSRSLGMAQEDGAPSDDDQAKAQLKAPGVKKKSRPLSLRIPDRAPRTEAAFEALQNLPIPLLVLSSSKTVVLANEAMGRLVGLGGHKGSTAIQDEQDGRESPNADLLLGQYLSQIGVDMLQSGQRIWVSWEVCLSVAWNTWSSLNICAEIPR